MRPGNRVAFAPRKNSKGSYDDFYSNGYCPSFYLKCLVSKEMLNIL